MRWIQYAPVYGYALGDIRTGLLACTCAELATSEKDVSGWFDYKYDGLRMRCGFNKTEYSKALVDLNKNRIIDGESVILLVYRHGKDDNTRWFIDLEAMNKLIDGIKDER